MKYLLSITLLFTFTLLFAQHSFSSIVVSKATLQPIENVHVYFKNSGSGTISNSEGKFGLNLLTSTLSDTLYFTHIGYVDTKIPVIACKDTIYMNEKTIQLDEIVIKPLDAREILQKAIDKIDSNYIPTDYLGTMKQTSSIDGVLDRLAMSDVMITEYKKNIDAYRDEKKQFKKEKASSLGSIKGFISTIDLFKWLQLKQQFKNALQRIDLYQDITINHDVYSDFKVYTILLTKLRTNNKKTQIKLVIEANSYAFIELQFFVDRGEGADEYKDNWWVVSKTEEKTISRIPELNTGKITFRPFNDKWMLSNIYTDFKVKYLIKENNKSEVYKNNFHTIEVWVNDINSAIKPKEKFKLDTQKDLSNQIENKIEATKFNVPLLKQEIEFIAQ